jgi:hypothetical protein
MVNYANGKIYKIEPIVESLDDGDIYIGSTVKEYLSQRMVAHRSSYNQWKNGSNSTTKKVYSFNLFEKYGLENCKITLLEICSCNSKDELLSREAHYIKTLKCVNKKIPLRTNSEWIEDNKEQYLRVKMNYLDANREEISAKAKQGREKDTSKINRKMYLEKNKEKIAEQVKLYATVNKLKISEYHKKYNAKKKAERS